MHVRYQIYHHTDNQQYNRCKQCILHTGDVAYDIEDENAVKQTQARDYLPQGTDELMLDTPQLVVQLTHQPHFVLERKRAARNDGLDVLPDPVLGVLRLAHDGEE